MNYRAVITLAAQSPYTFTADIPFAYPAGTVAGQDSSDMDVDERTVTVIYKPTQAPSVINGGNTLDLAGYIPAPRTAATAVLSFAADSFLGTVRWTDSEAVSEDGGVVSGPFLASKVYTAAITLYAAAGYTFTGVEGFCYGDEALTPLSRTDGKVMLEIGFPQTVEGPWIEDAGTVVSLLDLTYVVPAPARGGIPAATVVTEQYVGTVEWDPAVFGYFAAGTDYTATATLYPLPGYTFTGLTENFKHEGADEEAETPDPNPETVFNRDECTVTVTITFGPLTTGVINIDTLGEDGVPASGTGWWFADSVLTIRGDYTYTIEGTAEGTEGTPTPNRIVVAPYTTATIILKAGVNINVSEEGEDTCAFDMTKATVNLILADGSDTTLKSKGAFAGIQTPAGSTLTIRDDGKLSAYGGSGGAGIGDNRREDKIFWTE